MNVDLSKDDFVKPISKDGTSPEKGNLMNENVIANMTSTTKDKSYQSESNTDSTVL